MLTILKDKWHMFKIIHMVERIRKHPPRGGEFKNYHFKHLSDDELFVINNKLSLYDIALILDENTSRSGVVSAYAVKAFEAAKGRIMISKDQFYKNIWR